MRHLIQRQAWRPALLSVLILLPVYWQPRVQAGDLSSHIYNAWLAQLIESGRTQGLVIVRQTTNILFDLVLAALFRIGGAEFAQRVAVSIAVLVFAWGAFRFIGAVSGRQPWHLMPCIAMLAYGWVFHMGFFNFYLSLGFCFWALALLWNGNRRGLAFAAPLLLLAYTAHALPVIWALGLGLYRFAAGRVAPRYRIYATAAVLLAMGIVHLAAARTLFTRWSPQQIQMTTGADQLWVFDNKYYFVLMGLLMVWGFLFLDLVRQRGGREIAGSIAFQVCVISAAAVLILPSAVLLPGYHHALVFIAERMSLGVGICVCALLGTVQPRAFERYALIAVAVLFFGFLYRDERLLNAIEDNMERAVAQLDPGARVVNGVEGLGLRIFALTHMIDRACIGRCFSYANYEASTAQFRIRAAGDNPFVLAKYDDTWQVQAGQYVVKPTDLPLWQVTLNNGSFGIRGLKAGTPCGSTPLHALAANWLWSRRSS